MGTIDGLGVLMCFGASVGILKDTGDELGSTVRAAMPMQFRPAAGLAGQ